MNTKLKKCKDEYKIEKQSVKMSVNLKKRLKCVKLKKGIESVKMISMNLFLESGLQYMLDIYGDSLNEFPENKRILVIITDGDID